MGMINTFLTSNEMQWRLARTIFQGIIGVVIANLDLVIGSFSVGDVWRPVIAGIVMAVLSPVMAAIGNKQEVKDE